MFKSIGKSLNNAKGFSLVELIVVIAIIAVLAAIAIPNVMSVLENSKDKSDIATAATIAKAVQLAVADKSLPTGTYTLTAGTGFNNADINGYLSNAASIKMQKYTGTVTCVVDTGTVKVLVGTTQLYPSAVATAAPSPT